MCVAPTTGMIIASAVGQVINYQQQKAQQNLEAFAVWRATQTDDDFKQIIFRGQLNRGEVAKAIGCGKSASLINDNKVRYFLIMFDKNSCEECFATTCHSSIDAESLLSATRSHWVIQN